MISPGADGFAAPVHQTPSAKEKAQALLETMTPEERVGQLFLVNMIGRNTDENSEIYKLIADHHIGGVILKAENDNFAPPGEVLTTTSSLIRSLQQIERSGSQVEIIDSDSLLSYFPAYIPLFVGISQNGDGYPYDQIYSGLTQLPNPMAIGATWQPKLAERVGFVAGEELSALGFNLLLGPSLDVLENPTPESLGDLGVRTFGGDPYWVGLMGSAYTKGVHEGSEGKMAVIAKNFPGYGGSDRPPQEEVATVRKSLEQLKQIELAAFFSITGRANSQEATADGLLLAHVRYQGLLGNIRFTTRPISFDEQAFSTIISLPEFTSWRDDGGIILTDDLSSRAVRRFYDPTNVDFRAWKVIQDAFLAGSDLLYVGNINSLTDPDSFTSILFALDIFTQKYNTDLAFALRVNQSVLRILTLKYELYDSFELDQVVADEEKLANIGNNAISFEVARQGVTLISPTLEELESVVPDAPTLNDRIIFVTDTYTYQPCSDCPPEDTLGKETFRDAVMRLYGPTAGNQVIGQNLYSFTFHDLQVMLDNPGSFHEVEVRMRNAQWLVFSMQDVRSDRPISQALRRFLSERDDLLQNKRVIVFAFNAPYYLDTTDITKLTAYFGMYSKSPQYIDTAARILFKEFTPVNGKLPVSVDGISYNLINVTSPDPEQTISVFLDFPTVAEPTPEVDPQETPSATTESSPTPIINFQVGENVPIRTGVILDHNGFPVPDGTVVLFRFDRAGEISFSQPVETISGIARMIYRIPGGGQLEIRALSDPATLSQPLTLNIPGSEATVEPTLTPTPSPTVSPTLELTLTPTPDPPTEEEETPHTQTDFVDWGLGFLVTLAISLLAYRTSISSGQVRWGVRWALCAWIGGMSLYTYLALNLPGSLDLLIERGRAGIIWVISIGAGIGWAFGWVWTRFSKRHRPRPAPHPDASTPAKTRNG